MVPKSIIVFVILTFLLIADAKATPPSTNLRNIEFNVDIDNQPKKIGDIFEISWNFTLRESPDTMLQRLFNETDKELIAKAYMKVHPELEFISGDSMWWGALEYNRTYSLSALYRIVVEGRITGAPIVEICKEMGISDSNNRITKDIGRGFIIEIPFTGRKNNTFKVVTENGDTITHIVDVKLPKEFMTVDTNEIINPPERYSRNQNSQLLNQSLHMHIYELNNNDTVNISIIRDSVFWVVFDRQKPDSYKIENLSDADIVRKSPASFSILLSKKLQDNLIILTLDDKKVIYLKIRQTWVLDGYFKFDNPWGTDNPMDGIDCFFYERINNQWQEAYVTWTYPNGYFSFYTDKDTILTLV